jgi:hypothetical protein
MRVCGLAVAVCTVMMLAGATNALGDGLRTSTMGNCSIGLVDSDNQLNPYDFGGNPAFLLFDFDTAYNRMILSYDEQSGSLKRPFDPMLANDSYVSFAGRRRLTDNQAVWGRFDYDRFWQREQVRSLELDQYNDPFYLTDKTTGDILYYGPASSVSYSLRLAPKVLFGAGFDYSISTGLKNKYTRPQIIHNYFHGNVGLIVEANRNWTLGFMARPLRIQNRTEFAKTDEGYDNQIFRYSGDAIYEIRSFQDYSVRELLRGGELALQNFYRSDRINVGTIFTYGLVENKVMYNATDPEEAGFWQDETIDLQMLARYTPKDMPLTVGLSGRAMNQDGWAKRPRFTNVLLYDNPQKLRSLGAGASYVIRSLDLAVSADYVLNAYDIEANDYGANFFQHRKFTQNIGRMGLEYTAYNVFSLRGGVEVTDYVVDRWLKLPSNMDRYRFTAGGSYSWHLWQVEAQLLYARNTREQDDRERRDLSGILWFTRSE